MTLLDQKAALDTSRIHGASLDLLSDPGIKMEHDQIRDLLLKNGASPGNEPDVVRVPREMVEEYLALCPSDVHLADRAGTGRTINATSAPAIWSCPGMNMYENSAVRPFLADDMARMTRLLDKLENVDGVFGMAMEDVVPNERDVVGLLIMARNTKKHIRAFCFTPAGGEAMVRMKNVLGKDAWFSVGFTAHGPLRWTHLALDVFKATSGHAIPVTVNGEPMAGASGPVTIAGAAAVGNAEILGGIVAVQLMEPGRPCIYNLGLAHVFDMRTMIAVTGGPENALLAAISAAMGRHYNLPSASWVSTESMCPDSQAALEKMFGFASHISHGVSNIWGVGQLESELTISPAQAVMDNEMISYVNRFLRGVDTNEKNLAVDVTREVGITGSYLDHLHTAEFFRTELFMPKLLLRKKRDNWSEAGSKRLDEHAEDVAQQMMKPSETPALGEAEHKELQEIAVWFSKNKK